MMLYSKDRKEAIEFIISEIEQYIEQCEEDDFRYSESEFENLLEEFRKLSKKGTINSRQFKMINDGMWWQTTDAWNIGDSAVYEYVVQPLQKILASLKKKR